MQEQWLERLVEQVTKGLDEYTPIRVPLDDARADEECLIAAQTLFVQGHSSEAALATVRVNRARAGTLALRKGVRIDTIIARLFITNAALPGEWLDLVFGRSFDMAIVSELEGRVQTCFVVTNAVADTDTTAAANNCIAALVTAHPGNGGLAWLQWRTAAADAACYPLSAGDAVAVPVENTDQIHVLFKTANDKVTVTYKI